MTMGRSSGLDAVSFEILSHRLHQITREMAVTLERAGGTVNTTQMKDYMTALYRRDGDVLSAGESMAWHVACGSFAVKEIIKRFGEGEVRPGDMFMLNDPYVAAIHQSDVYILSPVHYDDELVAWSGTFVHVMDIGAMSPGGNSPGATEICHEGVRVPGLKIIEEGRVRQDVFDAIVNMTRQPLMVGLDLKCEIAANNVARARVIDVLDRYGLDVVEEVGDGMIRQTEEVLRRRLRDIQDGSWESTATITATDSWNVFLKLTKRGEMLTFDFEGTDPQADIGINLPYHATFGSCFEGVLSILGYDLNKNQGAFGVMEVKAPKGSILHPVDPAPVSLNTTAGGAAARYLASATLTQMISSDPQWSKEVMAQNLGMRFARHAGEAQDGRYYVSTLIGLSGGGARARGDGVHAAGIDLARPSSAHNVEWVEANFPVLVLFRRHAKDAGGVGFYRGGSAEEFALALHDAPRGSIDLVALGMAGLRNSGQGVLGGAPGAPSVLIHVEGSTLPHSLSRGIVPQSVDALSGSQRLLPYCEIDLLEDGVLYVRHGSGGGYGDPLARDPQAVLHDVDDSVVSPELAAGTYGVVVGSSEPRAYDGAATARLRARLRAERFERSDLAGAGTPAFDHPCEPAEHDRARRSGDGVARAVVTPSSIGGALFEPVDEHYLFEQVLCAACGELLDTAVTGKALTTN